MRHAAVNPASQDSARPSTAGHGVGLLICLALAAAAGCAESSIPEAERPLGVVDTPRPGEAVRPMPLLVGGWVVGPAGIAEVRVYLGEELKAVTRLTVPRPDVSKAHPTLVGENDLHGWNVEIELGPARGRQTLRVRVVDTQRRAADLVTVPISIEPW